MKETSTYQSGEVLILIPIMPDGTLCPSLMTEEEAIRFLRLDLVGIKNPSESLRRYRKLGWLRGVQVSKQVLYRPVDLIEFAERLAKHNPR